MNRKKEKLGQYIKCTIYRVTLTDCTLQEWQVNKDSLAMQIV